MNGVECSDKGEQMFMIKSEMVMILFKVLTKKIMKGSAS
jgi:hypothetical protein